MDVLAGVVDGLARQQRAINVKELTRHRVALFVREKEPVTLVLDRIAAGDDIDQEPPAARCGRVSPSCGPQRPATAVRAGPPPG